MDFAKSQVYDAYSCCNSAYYNCRQLKNAVKNTPQSHSQNNLYKYASHRSLLISIISCQELFLNISAFCLELCFGVPRHRGKAQQSFVGFYIGHEAHSILS